MTKPISAIAEPKGKLGILTPGMGAVATTFMAGVEAVRTGLAEPIGSLTQMGTIRLGKRTEHRSPMIKDFVPLAGLNDIEFGGWDIFENNAYDAAVKAGVLGREHTGPLQGFLSSIRPMSAVFSPKYVKKIDGPNKKTGANWFELAEQLKADIERFKKEKNVDRVVMVWCASTEIYITPKPVHQTVKAFEEGLKKNDPDIAPSMVYAYAAIS